MTSIKNIINVMTKSRCSCGAVESDKTWDEIRANIAKGDKVTHTLDKCVEWIEPEDFEVVFSCRLSNSLIEKIRQYARNNFDGVGRNNSTVVRYILSKFFDDLENEK